MGLVARFLEENGFSTVVLTTTPEFNREIGFPRVAAIEYPYGRVVGADALCKVTWADLFCGSHHYLDVVPCDDAPIV